jgi:hypothetical protein
MRYKRIETYRHTQNLLGTRKTYQAHAKLIQHTQNLPSIRKEAYISRLRIHHRVSKLYYQS